MTQDQHIAEALETEELNKEALRNWLEREEQRRELRKVVRKRVRGPRWSWVSRTVGGGGERMIGVIGEDDGEPEKGDVVQAVESDATPNKEAGPSNMPAQPAPTVPLTTATPAPSAPPVAIASPAPNEALAPNEAPAPSEPPATPAGPYTRNYLVLSNIVGGLPAELSVVLGSHVDWSNVQVIPGRNRPLSKSITATFGTNSRRTKAHNMPIHGLTSSIPTPKDYDTICKRGRLSGDRDHARAWLRVGFRSRRVPRCRE